MSKPDKEETKIESEARPNRGRGQNWLVLIMVVAAIAMLLFYASAPPTSTISYGFFLEQLEQRNIQYVVILDTYAKGTFRVAPPKPPTYDIYGRLEEPSKAAGDAELLNKNFTTFLPTESDVRAVMFAKMNSIREESREEAKKANSTSAAFEYDVAPGNFSEEIMMALMFLLPLAAIFVAWMMFRRSRDQIMGSGFLSSFSRSTAKRYEANERKVTFADVAGLEGVKADLQEIVEFLRSPEKFQKLGGRVPKGVLLNGPPGTGKTLLARAIAGEADVAFFSVSGSEFIQMFVGVGASRVRDLFQTAKENSPAIIFIDEIDAVGRQRGAGLGGGHDEREQTLNQILSEMDGFSPTDSTIIIAATNRPDVLDPALLRPGRFDRHITVGRPTLKGRMEIFKVHVRDVPLDDDVDLKRLAEGTVGLTGADIRNIVNEAALWAARNNKTRVGMEDFDYARDKILMGAKREEVMSDAEKEKTAYHEAGHTLAAWFLSGATRVHKVTIIPRGRSLGSTQIVPSEDRLSMSATEIRDQLVVLLAGRAAERLIYDETTAGAENDLERATGMSRRMVTHWGMSSKVGPVSYKTSEEDPFLGREIHQSRMFSEHTQELIDGEVAQILRQADERALQLLKERRKELELLKTNLLEREELSENEIIALIGPSVHTGGPDPKPIIPSPQESL